MLCRIWELFCITPATLMVAVGVGGLVRDETRRVGRRGLGLRSIDGEHRHAHICIWICICTELSMTFPFSIFSLVLRARTCAREMDWGDTD